ncbi:hypothetical protein ABIC83_002516 [Roseateles asaccharophilus]|uniref:hypothetical protein n=1 Tax=Roseateles asaccharophilus TaxID=582607 RepID=UPI00383711CD
MTTTHKLDNTSALTPQQRAQLLHLVDGKPDALVILPKSIPFDRVVAMGLDMGDVNIEFNAFDDVPAGAIRIRHSNFDDPVKVTERMTHESIAKDFVNLGNGSTRSAHFVDDAHDILTNEGTLHEEKFLGRLKDELEARVKAGRPLEAPTSFMQYSPAEIAIGQWGDAIISWMARTKEGKAVTLTAGPLEAAKMLYVTYRDEYRLTSREEIKAVMRAPSSPALAQAAKSLWPQEAFHAPAAPKSMRKARP